MNELKKTCLILLFAAFGFAAFSQRYFTKEGDISFYSEAPMEKIEAHNKRSVAIIDVESGGVEFAVLIKSFQFEKALMQEHFNENYMESSKYPKSTFKGSISNLDAVNFDEPDTYEVDVVGELTIHGETQTVETKATFIVAEASIGAKAKFIVACADYDIKIPKVVADNIAKEIEISIDVDLKPLVK